MSLAGLEWIIFALDARALFLHNYDKLSRIFFMYIFYYGNWTERSVIWAEIIHVISKSNESTARARFEITSMILELIIYMKKLLSSDWLR